MGLNNLPVQIASNITQDPEVAEPRVVTYCDGLFQEDIYSEKSVALESVPWLEPLSTSVDDYLMHRDFPIIREIILS